MLRKLPENRSFGTAKSALRLRESGGFDVVLHDTPITGNILVEGNQLLIKWLRSFSTSNFSDYNYIPDNYIIIPDGDTWAGGEPPLDGLTIYTDVSRMDDGTGAGIFSRKPIIKHSYSLTTIAVFFLGGDSCNREGSRIEIAKRRSNRITEPVTIYVESQRDPLQLSSTILHCKKLLSLKYVSLLSFVGFQDMAT